MYEKQSWGNGPDGGTPISADRLNHLETQAEAVLAEVGEPGGIAGLDGDGRVPDNQLPEGLVGASGSSEDLWLRGENGVPWGQILAVADERHGFAVPSPITKAVWGCIIEAESDPSPFLPAGVSAFWWDPVDERLKRIVGEA